MVSVASLLVTMVAGSLPAAVRRPQTAALVVVMPLACLVARVVPADHASGVVMVALGCAAAALVPMRWPTWGGVSTVAGIGLLIAPRFPADGRSAVLLLAGGVVALALVAVTEPLGHPRLRLPALPTVRRTPATGDQVRRHAVRLGTTIGVAATISLLVGHTSTFTAHSSWMLLAAWIALQPQPLASRHMALSRGAGTAAGAVVTLLLAFALPHTIWIGWAFLLLLFLAFGLRTVNHTWYCVLLTPVVVLGFAGTPLDPEMLAARVAWTAAGVLLAAVAAGFWAGDTDPAEASARTVPDAGQAAVA